MGLRHFIGCACFAWLVTPALAQDERPAEVIRAPTPQVIGSRAQVNKLLEGLADASEPRVIEVKSGTEIVGLLRTEYGDAAPYMWPFVVRANEKSAFYATLRDAGQSLPRLVTVSKNENTFVLPSGPYWQLEPSPVAVDKGDTLQTLAVKHMGARQASELRKAQELIKAINPHVNFAKLAAQATILIPERTIARPFVPTSDVGSFEDDSEFASQGTPEAARQTKASVSCEAKTRPIDWDAVKAVLTSNAITRTNRRLESQRPYVAVLDSGIDASEEARDRFDFWKGGPLDIVGVDVSEDEHARDIPPWSDRFRSWELRNHGTHVAGLVHGGTADVRSVLRPISKLMILKVVSADRSASAEAPIVKYTSLMAAFDWALEYEASILNLSVEPNSVKRDLWGLERYKGLLFVVSAGNGMGGGVLGPRGVNVDLTWLAPAGFGGHLSKNVVSVAAVDSHGELASFSNYGGASITLAAPGCELDSYIAEAGDDDGAAGAIRVDTLSRRISGTSQATALVSALAAILKSYQLSAAEIKFRLISSVDILPCPPPPPAGQEEKPCLRQNVLSAGIVNPVKALRIYQDLVEFNTGEIKLGQLSSSTSHENTLAPTLCFKNEKPCLNLSAVGKISSFSRQQDGSYKARIVTSERPTTTSGFEVMEKVLASDLIFYVDSAKQPLNLENTRDIVLKRR